ncbi:hypothetical protein L3X38_031344 [Prunus dulcis]|uniref:NFD4 C-terminal domain-containing protein n=1 Tax=Prunus dulcis TaxID=3755 RepID=A0AAD4VDG6_PRUDU|nr:hypothetical protein L3X38_031344 [Prunus dulcis]
MISFLVANISIGSFAFGYLSAIVYQREANHEDGKCPWLATEALSSSGVVFVFLGLPSLSCSMHAPENSTPKDHRIHLRAAADDDDDEEEDMTNQGLGFEF